MGRFVHRSTMVYQFVPIKKTKLKGRISTGVFQAGSNQNAASYITKILLGRWNFAKRCQAHVTLATSITFICDLNKR